MTLAISVVPTRQINAPKPALLLLMSAISAIASQMRPEVTPASRPLPKLCMPLPLSRTYSALQSIADSPAYTGAVTRRPEPDAETAARLVAESDRILVRQRRVGQASMGAPGLLAWGLAWLVAYPALDRWPDRTGGVVAAAAILIAVAVSWAPRDTGIRTGFEGRIRLGWVLTLLSSPFLISSVAPLEGSRFMLLLGALWGLAMALTGVALRDTGLTVVGLAAVVAAGVAPWQHSIPALTFCGLLGGPPMAVLALARLIAARRLTASERPAAGNG